MRFWEKAWKVHKKYMHFSIQSCVLMAWSKTSTVCMLHACFQAFPTQRMTLGHCESWWVVEQWTCFFWNYWGVLKLDCWENTWNASRTWDYLRLLETLLELLLVWKLWIYLRFWFFLRGLKPWNASRTWDSFRLLETLLELLLVWKLWIYLILIPPQGFETMKCFKNLRLLKITWNITWAFTCIKKSQVSESQVKESQVIQVHKSQKVWRPLRSVNHR